MWKNGQHTNENGEAVRLYQPILYSRKLPQEGNVSKIGGRPSYFVPQEKQQSPTCANCNDELYLLMQLYLPTERKTLHVLSCNRASCYTFDSSFSVGGGGAVCCQRSNETIAPENIVVPTLDQDVFATTELPWDSLATSGTDTDWDVKESDDTDNLEDMLEQLEFQGPKGIGIKPKKATKKSSISSNVGVSFSCYELSTQQENMAMKITENDDDDDDDVGISSGASDAKIRAMLARYMAEEDDEEILTALKGGNNNSSGGGGGGARGRREKDERLSADDRALFVFTDRIQRAPRQVVRYAKGGEPLWSVPLPKTQLLPNRRGTHHLNGEEDFLKVPACPCGADRVFECQLMPSLLHVLRVDKLAMSQFQPQNLDQIMNFENGGQNWGTMAVYTCPMNCKVSSEEFVIVQASVDGTPEKRQQTSMVVAVDMEGDDETIEAYNGGIDDEPWSDEDEGEGEMKVDSL